MKKLIRFGAWIFGILLALIIILPIALKGTVQKKITEALDEQIDATIGLESVSLSLISSFPKLSIDIEGLTVDGKGEFKGVRLADIGSIHLAINLSDVWSDDGVTIKEISMDNVAYHLLVLSSGKANWDIAIASESTEEVVDAPSEPEEEADFALALQSYAFTNHSIIYDDREGDIYFELTGLNHRGAGDFSASSFDLETSTDWSAMTCSYEGMTYLKKVQGSLDANLGVDMETMTIRFNDNKLLANGLALQADGSFTMGEEEYGMDITFASPNTDFASWWSIIPSAYTADYSAVKASGAVSFDGYVKGTYKEAPGDTLMPAFGFALKVDNASVQYPDLPSSISALFVDFEVECPSSNMDETVVDLRELSADLGDNKLWLSMHLDHPMSDPNIALETHSQINLASFADFMPVEDTLTGSIVADFMFAGKQSDVEQERYTDVKAGGKLMILDFEYYSQMFHMPMYIRTLNTDWSTQHVEVSNAVFEWGGSDIKMNGRLENLLFYYLGDAPLKGSIDVASTKWSVDEWMAVYDSMYEEEVASADSQDASEGEEEVYEPIELPSDIEMSISASVNQVLYDTYDLRNLRGRIQVKPRQVILDQCGAEMMGGSAKIDGLIHTPVDEPMNTVFDMEVSNWDIPTIAKSCVTVKEMVPMIASSRGTLSGKFKWDCDMDSTLEVISSSVVSKGVLKVTNLKVENNVLRKVDETLKSKRFYPLELDKITLSYTIKDGRIEVDPIDFNIDQTDAVLSGHAMIDGELNYLIETTTPLSALGSSANEWAGALQSKLSQLGMPEDAIGDEVKMNIRITGTSDDPKITPEILGTDGVVTDIKDQVKEVIEEKIEEKIEEVKEDLSEKADALIADARKKADELNAEAAKRAQQVREEGRKAAERIRREADDQAKKLLDEARNPLEKKAAQLAGEKLKKEADAKAADVEAEANRKANQIEAEAKKQGDSWIESAQREADEMLKSED